MHDFLILQCNFESRVNRLLSKRKSNLQHAPFASGMPYQFSRLLNHHAPAKFLDIPLCFVISRRLRHEFDFTRVTVEKDFIAFPDLLP